MIYHVGIRKDYSNPNRVIVQLRQNIECLSCELWEYWGERETTKEHYKRNRKEILEMINREHGTLFKSLLVE